MGISTVTNQNQRRFYLFACRLVAIGQPALIYKRGVPLDRRIQLLFALPLGVLLRRPVLKPRIHATDLAIRRLLRGCLLLLDSRPHILEVRGISGRDDVIGRQHGPRPDQAQLFAQLQVGRVRRLIVVQEHEIDAGERARGVKAADGRFARADDDLDDVTQPGQVDQACDDGRELRVALEAEVALAAGALDGIAEQDARVADVATELDHGGRSDLCDERGHNLALVVTHIHEVFCRARVLVNGGEHGGRVVADLLNAGLRVDKVEELNLAAIVELVKAVSQCDIG